MSSDRCSYWELEEPTGLMKRKSLDILFDPRGELGISPASTVPRRLARAPRRRRAGRQTIATRSDTRHSLGDADRPAHCVEIYPAAAECE